MSPELQEIAGHMIQASKTDDDQAMGSAVVALGVHVAGVLERIAAALEATLGDKTDPTDGQEALADVYNRPECIFHYCPDPQACRGSDTCLNPRKL